MRMWTLLLVGILVLSAALTGNAQMLVVEDFNYTADVYTSVADTNWAPNVTRGGVGFTQDWFSHIGAGLTFAIGTDGTNTYFDGTGCNYRSNGWRESGFTAVDTGAGVWQSVLFGGVSTTVTDESGTTIVPPSEGNLTVNNSYGGNQYRIFINSDGTYGFGGGHGMTTIGTFAAPITVNTTGMDQLLVKTEQVGSLMQSSLWVNADWTSEATLGTPVSVITYESFAGNTNLGSINLTPGAMLLDSFHIASTFDGIAGIVPPPPPVENLWSGATSGDYSNTANWTLAQVPLSTETAVFGATDATTTTVVLNGNQTVGGAKFQTGAYTIGDPASSDELSISAGGSIVKKTTDTANVTINSTINMLGDLTLTNNNGWVHEANMLIINGLKGTNTLHITGTDIGGVQMVKDNTATFSGPISIESGMLYVAAAGALGTGDVTFSGGQLWTTNANATISNKIIVDGNVSVASVGGMRLNGEVQINEGRILTTNNGGGNSMTFGGTITGSGSLNMSVGNNRIIGTESNTLSGPIVLSSDSGYDPFNLLRLGKTNGATAIAGPLYVTNQGKVLWRGNDQISDSSPITLGGGRLQFNRYNETMGTLTVNPATSSQLTTLDFSAIDGSAGPGANVVKFADSSALTWDGALQITSWNLYTSDLYFGSSNTALTTDQLSLITFVNPQIMGTSYTGSYLATLMADGLLVPQGLDIPARPVDTSVVWNVDADGNYSDAANWTYAPTANAVVKFGSVITAPRTVTVDAPATVDQITFDNAQKYTLAGPNAITLAGVAKVDVVSGTHEIAAPLAGTVGLNKGGTGELVLSGDNSALSGGVNVNEGTLALASDTALGTNLLSVGTAGTLTSVGAPRTISNEAVVVGTIGGDQPIDFSGTVNANGGIVNVTNTALTTFSGTFGNDNNRVGITGEGNVLISGTVNASDDAEGWLGFDASTFLGTLTISGTVKFNQKGGSYAGMYVGEMSGHNTGLTTLVIASDNALQLDNTGTRFLYINNGVTLKAAGTARTIAGEVDMVGTVDFSGDADAQPLTLTDGWLASSGPQTLRTNSTTSPVTITNLGEYSPADLVKEGPGTLIVTNPTYTGSTTVNAGKLVTAKFQGRTLTVNDGGIAQIASNSGVSIFDATSTLTINGGKLDLKNNSMIVKAGDLAAIQAQIKSGYASGAWTGSGIVTTVGAAGTGLGVDTAGHLGLTTFAGQAVDAADVLVKYTWMGDADFNGVVNFSDFLKLQAGYGKPNQTWTNGDFNYDGSVNFSDFLLLQAAYGKPAVSETVAPVSVPEPATLSLLALGGLALLRRRSHKA